MVQLATKLSNNRQNDAEIAISFLCAVIDGYEHSTGSQHRYIKPHLRQLKEFFKSLRDSSAILSNQDNPHRINEACADKLHAASWRVFHALEKQQGSTPINDSKVKALSDLRDYCCSAFDRVFEAQLEPNLDPAPIILASNKSVPHLVPQAA